MDFAEAFFNDPAVETLDRLLPEEMLPLLVLDVVEDNETWEVL